MSTAQRRFLRIVLVGAIVGGIAGWLNFVIDKGVSKATRA